MTKMRISMCENRCPRDHEEVGHNTGSLIMDQCDIDDSIITLSDDKPEMIQEHTVEKCKSAFNNSIQQYKILFNPTFRNPEKLFLYLDEVLDKILHDVGYPTSCNCIQLEFHFIFEKVIPNCEENEVRDFFLKEKYLENLFNIRNINCI